MRFLFSIAIAFSAACLHAQAITLKDGTVLDDAVPAGAPTATCTIPPVRDASKLLVITGDAPVAFVFACGHNRPEGKCAVMLAKPGSNDLPLTNRFTSAGTRQGEWSCVEDSEGTSGWIPSNRLAPLAPTPAITTADWLGWWRSGPDSPGIKNDRLLITRSKTEAKILHVSGRAYWYGLNDNVHFGQVDADASAYGDTLHIVEGDDGFCTVDLVYHPNTHTFTAMDNQGCGGMNVRFMGEWQRFTPRVSKSR